jgi:hypothetical protein
LHAKWESVFERNQPDAGLENPGEFEPCEPGNMTAAGKGLESVEAGDEAHQNRDGQRGAD